tara:strand:+ start:70 stop:270 length:201 start_codon:yes stop_codon:yes gene_type:complete
MGEAKRRKELGLPPKSKNKKKHNAKETILSWSKFYFGKFKNMYPAAPIVSTALFLLLLQWGFSLNS